MLLQVRKGTSPKMNIWKLLEQDFQAACNSCHPSNSIKAVEGHWYTDTE